MYRDHSLMPKEAIRLAVLGTLQMAGPIRYADLAVAVRHFTARIVGPSLDLMGTSLEMLRFEGLIVSRDGTGGEDNALLDISAAGRAVFLELMGANIRSPSADDLNKLVVALKLRFLHLLDRDGQRHQVQTLIDLYASELVRLGDLARSYSHEPGHFAAWLENDMAQIEASLAWFRTLQARL